MTLKVADNDELVGWILRFGGQGQVAQPETLRAKVREEAKKVLSSRF
jgi:predicted DNA-binding transcriptional regulator YafY